MFTQLSACSTQITASEDMVTWFNEKTESREILTPTKGSLNKNENYNDEG